MTAHDRGPACQHDQRHQGERDAEGQHYLGVRALARRGPVGAGPTLSFGDLSLDPRTRVVSRGNTLIALSTKEFQLLEVFMRRPGQVLSRYDLLEGAWDMAYENRSNVVDVYVRYLREKIDRPFGIRTIETVRGAGYRLSAPARQPLRARQRDTGVRTSLWRVRNRRDAVVRDGDGRDHGQPQPAARRTRPLPAGETLERSRRDVLGEPAALIEDVQAEQLAVVAGGQRYRAAAVPQRVGDEVISACATRSGSPSSRLPGAMSRTTTRRPRVHAAAPARAAASSSSTRGSSGRGRNGSRPASARASTRMSSASLHTRRISSAADLSAARSSLASRFPSNASSTSVRSAVSGVRSSWLAALTSCHSSASRRPRPGASPSAQLSGSRALIVTVIYPPGGSEKGQDDPSTPRMRFAPFDVLFPHETPKMDIVLSWRAMEAVPDLTRRAGEVGSFGLARERWLGGLGNVRNVVRQEIITRQLRNHLPDRPSRILDVGAGQGTQCLRLARAGHRVVAVEPDPEMRAQLLAAQHTEPADAGERVKVVAGSVGDLESAIAAERYDVVLCLGVLMYLPESRPAVTELARYVAPGGLLCVAVRTPVSAVWRPAARQDWHAALEALDESATAQARGRDMRYLNEIGAPARTDGIGTLAEVAAQSGLELVRWYGVRVAVDLAELDPPAPADPLQLAALLDVEERLGAIDPYRQLAQLAHLIFRRPHAGPVNQDSQVIGANS